MGVGLVRIWVKVCALMNSSDKEPRYGVLVPAPETNDHGAWRILLSIGPISGRLCFQTYARGQRRVSAWEGQLKV